MKKSVKKTKLSIIILNYNSGGYLASTLTSIYLSKLTFPLEIIIVDNASTDESFKLAKLSKSTNRHISQKFLSLPKNIGFSAGNNQGVKKVSPHSQYVLFLNPDTTLNPDTIQKMVDLFEKNPQVDAATCKVILALNHQLQPECHRGFPTPWRSFCHFSGISKIFPKSKILNGYFLGHLDTDKTHQIEACVGAFLMVKKSVGKAIGWWNEKYFFYGDDLDFCYKLRLHDFKLYFYPKCSITHFQGISSGIISQTKKKSLATRETKVRSALASTQAMRIFYQDNLLPSYSAPLRWLVMSGIKLLEVQRLLKAKYL